MKEMTAQKPNQLMMIEKEAQRILSRELQTHLHAHTYTKQHIHGMDDDNTWLNVPNRWYNSTTPKVRLDTLNGAAFPLLLHVVQTCIEVRFVVNVYTQQEQSLCGENRKQQQKRKRKQRVYMYTMPLKHFNTFYFPLHSSERRNKKKKNHENFLT